MTVTPVPSAPASPASPTHPPAQPGSPPQPLATLAIRPWPDPVIDTVGFDPRSAYVERFWLGILGPSTTWLMRRLAAGLEAHPDGYDLPLAATAHALGLGAGGGRHSPFMRALARCCQFDLAQAGADGMAVRRKVPPLSRRLVMRLSPELAADHQQWQNDQLAAPPAELMRRRVRRLALSLVELGEDREATERQLLRWKFHPALCQEATAWALDRHRQATT